MASLREFAEANKAVFMCAVCKAPPKLLEQVHEVYADRDRDGGYRKGLHVTFPTMARWLDAEGYHVTPVQLKGHFEREHHRQ